MTKTEFDALNRTVRMPWKKTTGGDVLTDIAYGYDAASRRTWRQDMTPESEAAFDRFYGYDALGQVKAAERGTLNGNRTAIGGVPEEAEAWNYDEQGNWLKYLKAEDGVTEIDQHRRNNQSNQIATVDGSNAGVAYDKNGNMLRVPTGDALTGPPRHLKWNAWNQLVEVRDDEDELIQRNVYDALFRRITRELNDSTEIHCYYNDQWRPVEERIDTSTDASAVYFWGARYRDDLARRDRDTNADGTLDESLWCLMDYFDPVAVIDDEGEVVERYSFSAFGVANILAPNYSVRGSSTVAWHFLFHGQFEDAETGWQNYGYRFYVPELGRWPSRDPIGEEGGVSLYEFSKSDPVNFNDIFGLNPSCCENEKYNPSTHCCIDKVVIPKATDDAGRKCCEDELEFIELHSVPKGNSGKGAHSFISTPGMTRGFYPGPGAGTAVIHAITAWGDAKGEVLDDQYSIDPANMVKKYRSCPETTKIIQENMTKPNSEDYHTGNMTGMNCAGWACSQLNKAGITPPVAPGKPWISPNSLFP